MDRILVVIHFGTQGPSCEWMAWITHHPRSPSFRDLYQKTAGIWAIIGTDRSFDLSWHKSLPTDKSIFHLGSDFNLILIQSVMAGWSLPYHQNRSFPLAKRGAGVIPHLKGVGATSVALQMGRLKPPLPIVPRFSDALRTGENSLLTFFNRIK